VVTEDDRCAITGTWEGSAVYVLAKSQYGQTAARRVRDPVERSSCRMAAKESEKCQRQMIKLCSRQRDRLREQVAKCSRRAAQKIVAKFKAGKPSTDANAKLIEEEFGELNP